jgi:hypothetical protein
LTDEIFTPSVLASATPAIPDDIGEDAKQVLHEAASDRNGYILVSEGLTRPGFSTNGQFFGDQGPRDFARWKAALEELSDADLIRQGSVPTTFIVTNKGYKKAT